ncbi:hypothetical protein G8B22_08760 [Ligilactobacillus agilis]|uniref:hypothetical protein n=1 Tax=Ligilactobacillus agilis TaxID=1601 RepID=UPI001F578AE7|nr:hypothetical protein [Ligilactobacillus agilis]UNL43216.1 hypothetical protein G8B22_08760 [Ligilactobacillus agilis]UNL57784.1 hypothetical protein G8B19_02940 [Ligilactobacillus agilis]
MRKVFLDKNGKLNRKTITSLVLLLVVLVQQLCAIFGIKFTGDPSRIMDLVNTLLTIGGILGLVDGVTVDTETVKSIDETANEALKLASQHQSEEGNDEKSN